MQKHGSLNHIYRLVWSKVSNGWIAVAETAKGRSKGRNRHRRLVATALTVSVISGLGGISSDALAGPTGGKVASGSATITNSQNSAGLSTTIKQTSPSTTIDWTSFNIGTNESVTFLQPSTTSVAINQIAGNTSSILGRLSANGEVFLINPNGIVFGQTAQVNVGGLVASALAGNGTQFNGTNTPAAGTIVNSGNIHANKFVVLLGSSVTNQGTVSTAPLGTIILGAGNNATLTLDNGVHLKINQSTLQNLVENGGLIQADGGTILLTAGAKNELMASAVNNTGVIEARTVGNQNGTISLLADLGSGTVNLGGTLDASAPNGGDGGKIETSAHQVKMAAQFSVKTNASAGKNGNWLIDPVDFNIGDNIVNGETSDISGAALSTALAAGNVTISTAGTGPLCTGASCGTGSANGEGDININASVSWTGTTLSLLAQSNVNVYQTLSAGPHAGLILGGSGASPFNYYAPINLASDASFTTQLSVKRGPVLTTNYTIINSLGSASDSSGTGPTTPSLQGMAAANNLAGNFVLGSSIDASDTNLWSGGFTPIGSPLGSAFTGTFNGLGHAIQGLTINSTTQGAGLFGSIGQNAVVGNVSLNNVNISGPYQVGGLAGVNAGTISNVAVSGSVSIAMPLPSTPGPVDLGGLVGFNDGGVIKNSYSIAAANGVGGQNVGGLVGHSSGGTIENSYAIGSVIGADFVGGLVGYGTNTVITTTYAAGAVSAALGSQNISGLIGNSDSSNQIFNSYWDSTNAVNASSASQNPGANQGVPLTTAQMSNAGDMIGFVFNNTPYGGGWVSINVDGSINGNAGGTATYPMLISEYSPGIANAHQLQLMSLNPVGNYTLLNNIDATNTGNLGTAAWSDVWNSGTGFLPINGEIGSSISKPLIFGGSLDGQNNTISGLTISNPKGDYLGLFNDIGSRGIIENINLANVNISGVNNVGALAALNGGTISNCNVLSGSVTASGLIVGGLVGASTRGNFLSDSSAATVNGTHIVGGLIGSSEGDTVTTSSASGAVNLQVGINSSEDGQYGGGLIGQAQQSILDHSFSSGNVTGPAGYLGGLVGISVGSTYNQSYTAGSKITSTDDGLGSEHSYLGGLIGLSYGDTVVGGFTNAHVSGANINSVGGLIGAVSNASNPPEFPLYSGTMPTTINNASAEGSVLGLVNVGGLVGYNTGNITHSGAYATVSGNQGNVSITTADIGGLVGFNLGSTVNSTAFGVITNSVASGNVTGTQSAIGGLVGENQGTINSGFGRGMVSGANQTGGLVGLNDASGVITNSNAGGTTSGTIAGGLVGQNIGLVSGSFASGQVTGTATAGGLVGLNSGNAVINNSYATNSVSGFIAGGLVGTNEGIVTGSFASGAVTGTENIGGLVGSNDFTGSIIDSYSTGSASGLYAGGLVGTNRASITTSYATGQVSSGGGGLVGRNDTGQVSNSFWNNTINSQDFSGGGSTGVSAAVLSMPSTFAGWDFTNTWFIYPNETFPLLRSFMTPISASLPPLSPVIYTGTPFTEPGSNLIWTDNSGNPIAEPTKHLIGNTITGPSNIGVYTNLIPTGIYSDQLGYLINFAPYSLTISPSQTPVTLSGVTVNPLLFNGSTTATLSGGTLQGLLPGDVGNSNVVLTLTGNFASPNASYKLTDPLHCSQLSTTSCTPVPVTVTASLSGPDAYKYSLTNQTLTLSGDILPDPVLVTTTASNKVYDGTSTANVVPTATEIMNLNGTWSLVTLPKSAITPTATGQFIGWNGPTSNAGTWLVQTSNKITVPNPTSNNNANDYWLFDPLYLAGSASAPLIPSLYSITPASLYYVATPTSVAAGSKIPPLTGTVAGFINGLTLSQEIAAGVISGVGKWSTTATSKSPAGYYPINGSGYIVNSANYVLQPSAANPDNAFALCVSKTCPDPAAPPFNPNSQSTGLVSPRTLTTQSMPNPIPDSNILLQTTLPGLQIKSTGVRLPDDAVAMN